jgi:hypothetical protein
MKRAFLSLILLLAVACFATAAPRLTVEQAAAIAQKNLKDRGVDGQIYVISVVLEPAGVLNKEMHWRAMWSASIPGDTDSKNKTSEVGLQINMDGSVVRLIEGAGNLEALRNPRTRSDRPSILDLKH